MTQSLPLVLDMDGTLLLSDTLVESLAERLFANPLQLLTALPTLAGGRAPFKARISAIARPDFAVLPARQDLAEYAQAAHEAGRSVYLVTAADQAVADQVAARFGFFDGAIGSDGCRNLKGAAKQAYLRQRFPDGYVYAGDSGADLKVWRDADGIVLAGASAATRRKAEALGTPIEARFDNTGGGLKPWIKALRLHQWAKNLLVFVPLILSGFYMQTGAVASALFAFFGMGLAASGTYLLNDLADLSSDRRHRSKHTRPFASGQASLALGLLAAPVLIAAGLALTALGGSLSAGLALAAYLVVTLSYSFGLKRKAVLDVALLAALFTLRLLIGATAISAELSVWLFSFSMFFFFSLSLAKRHVEIAAAAPGEAIRGRGYQADDAPLSLALGTSSAMAAIVILCLYLIEDAFPNGLYANPDWLMAAPVGIGLWTIRIWLLAHRGDLDDDPVSFAVRDRLSLGMGGLLAVAFVLASL